jgi:hypothetical protein
MRSLFFLIIVFSLHKSVDTFLLFLNEKKMFLREEQTSKSGFVRVIILIVEHQQRQQRQHRHQRPLVQQIFCPKKLNQIHSLPASTITNCCENVCRPQLNVGFNYFGFFFFKIKYLTIEQTIHFLV